MKTLLSAMLTWQFLGSNLKVRLLLWPSLITIFNNENTQRALKNACHDPTGQKPSLYKDKFTPEASLAVYSYQACSIVVLVDMGMTATFKKPHYITLHYQYLHVLVILI